MRQKYTKTEKTDDLQNTSARDIMQSNVLTVYEGWSIRRLSQFFQKHRISGAPVIASDDELVGVVSQSDVVRFQTRKPDEKDVNRIVERFCGNVNRELSKSEIEKIQDQAFDYMTVNDIMTEKPIVIDTSASLEEVFLLLKESRVHRLFVVQSGKLVGVLTAMDILENLLEED